MRIRKAVHLRLLLLRFRIQYAISLVVAALGVIQMLLSDLWAVGALASAAGTTWSVGALTIEGRRQARAREDFFPVGDGDAGEIVKRIRDEQYCLRDVDDGYRVEVLQGQAVMWSPEINQLLDSSRAELTLEGEYGLNSLLEELAPSILHHQLTDQAIVFNDRKVRLADDITVERLQGTRPLRTEETRYAWGICSNELAKVEIWSKRANNTKLAGQDLVFDDDGCIYPLSASECSNHVGVSTLALLDEGKTLVTAIQSRHSAQNPNLLTTAGSGSADLSDLAADRGVGRDTLRDFVLRASLRELWEECGLPGEPSQEHVTRASIIGFARLLNRGGKPEFFSVVSLPYESKSLDIPTSERPFLATLRPFRLDRTDECVRCSLSNIIESNEGSLSIQLRLGIKFLTDHMRRRGSIHAGAIRRA